MDDLPAVEMLWESADPGEQLTARFGFPDGAAAATWVADVLARYWDLDVGRCDRLVISDRNVMAWVEAGGRPYIGKWSSLPRRFPRLDDAAKVVGRGRGGRRQLVHNDFRSANILHDGTAISAVLDFEELTYETRAADIAKAAVLLATRYRDCGPTSAHVGAAFMAAYDDHARDPLTPSERQEADERMTTLLKAFGWTETKGP